MWSLVPREYLEKHGTVRSDIFFYKVTGLGDFDKDQFIGFDEPDDLGAAVANEKDVNNTPASSMEEDDHGIELGFDAQDLNKKTPEEKN